MTRLKAIDKSELWHRFYALGDQVPWLALKALADTLEEGKAGKYKDDPLQWRNIFASVHHDRAEMHFNYNLEDNESKGIAHYITRSLMAGEKMLEETNGSVVVEPGPAELGVRG